MIRDLQKSDLVTVRRFDQKGITLPDWDNRNYIGRIVEDPSGNIVACGILWPIIEAFVLINESIPSIARAKAIVGLVEEMKRSNAAPVYHSWCVTKEMQSLLFKLGFRPSKYPSMIYGEE